jgi:hypothetical protein
VAHEVRAKVDTKVVAHKDLEIVVKTSRDGKLGKLLISKGNVEWLPKGNSVKKRRLSWKQFADLFEQEGRLVRAKKGRRTPD